MNTKLNKLNTEYKQIADAFDRCVIKHKEPEPDTCCHCGEPMPKDWDMDCCLSCDKQLAEVMATW